MNDIVQNRVKDITHILTSTSSFGKDVIPRLAAAYDIQPITDVIKIVDSNTFVRPTYAGNAVATVKSNDKVKAITIRATNFEKLIAQEGKSTEIIVQGDYNQLYEANKDKIRFVNFVKEEISGGDKPELTSARIVS